ncbi:unnamed protein product [Adineta ricciae]|uniref:Uncharacterized protein n=1 Tax=Adineta ricciae TaxID=249248 RepID=A0A814ERT9_ADIRI|nr:unnamed protein product [Adineta ricciae]
MENIALTDSNDDLTSEVVGDQSSSHLPSRMFAEQQHVTSELHDAANTDVTKAPFVTSANTPFRPLFPALNNSPQLPSNGSPLLFQQKGPAIPTPTMNPLLQSPASVPPLSSTLLQPTLRPPLASSAFQPPTSAFTPLNPANTQLSTSLIQPKLTIGNQSNPLIQPSPFPLPRLPTVQGSEMANVPPPMTIPPPTQDIPIYQPDTGFPPSAPPPQDLNHPVPPPLPPPPPSQPIGTSATNPFSARASLTERIYPSMPVSQAPLQPQQLPPPISFQQQQQQQNPLPVPTSTMFVPPPPPPAANSTIPNVYPGTDPNTYNLAYQPPGEPSLTPWSNYPPQPTAGYDQLQQDSSSANAAGIWGWISNNKMLATVVEKAKTGIETVITTVDPQMKQYIQPGHEVHIVVTSAKDVKLTPVRDAFTHVFGRATTQGIGVQSNVAPQPIGFEAGFKGAQQRIENLRRQNVVRPDQCVVSIENFIAELVPDMYFDLGYVLLSDPLNSIELHLFTQAIPVPIEYVYQARDRTPADYPLKWSGYMVTVGEVLHSQMPFVNPEDWHEMMSGTSRREIIYATCKTLASHRFKPVKSDQCETNCLSQDELQCLNKLIGNQCDNLATAVVQILHENQNRWRKQACGILCFVTDYEKHIYCFRLYDLQLKESIYEAFVPSDLRLKYIVDGFYTFDGMTCKVGINFAQQFNAEVFCNQFHAKQDARQKKSSITTHRLPEQIGSTFKSWIFKGRKSPVISAPLTSTFVHGAHIGPDGSYVKNEAQRKLFEEVLACMNLSQEEQTYVRENIDSNNGILEELFTKNYSTMKATPISYLPPVPPRPTLTVPKHNTEVQRTAPTVQPPAPPPIFPFTNVPIVSADTSSSIEAKPISNDATNSIPKIIKPVETSAAPFSDHIELDPRDTLQMNIREMLKVRRIGIMGDKDTTTDQTPDEDSST